MEFSRLGRALRRRWVWLVSFVMIGIAAGLVVPFYMPATYDASAQSFVSIQSGGEDGSAYQDSQFAMSRVKSYTQLVQSPEVLEPVAEELGLTVSELRNMVSATSPTNSVLINVTAQAGDAQLAADIANDVSAELGAFISDVETPDGRQPAVEVVPVRPAEPPAAPTSPRPRLILALGLVIGLMAGVAAAILRQEFDRSIRTSDGLKAVTGSGELASIPVDGFLGGSAGRSMHTGTAESFRTLRVNLRFLDVDRPPRSVLVTSFRPNEGKSTTAYQLAVAIAESGQSVCVIDADMRRAALGRRLGLDQTLGLSSVLSGEFTVQDALVPVGVDGLSVLPAGPTPPDPAAVLGSQAMHKVMAELSDSFEVIVVDTPPLGVVVDAVAIATAADATLVTVRHAKTNRDSLRHSVEILQRAGVQTIGTVLTFVPRRRGTEYTYTGRRRWAVGRRA